MKLDDRSLARRVAREFQPGDVVALGKGLPGLVPGEVPPGLEVQFLSDAGALGYHHSPKESAPQSSSVDSDGQVVSLLPGASVSGVEAVAAMLRGGHVDVAVIQPAQVDAKGDFVHWTTAATPGINAPGTGVDLAFGGRRVIAMMPHVGADGSPNILDTCSYPIDGAGCIDLIVTDAAVMQVTGDGLLLLELAPGWKSDDVLAITGSSMGLAPNLTEMTFDVGPGQAPQKVYSNGPEAVFDLPDGATVMIDGFAGPGGMPHYLLVSLRDHGAKDLTIISNTAGIARVVSFGTPPGRQAIDHSILIDNQQVKKAIASYPVSPSASRPSSFELAYRRGEVELELVPQGTLAERLRAGGAGIPAFYTPTGVGTRIAEGKETRTIDGKEYLLELGLRADYCLIRGHRADPMGNVVYKGTSRNFNAVMAPAAAITIVEVDQIVEPGSIDPEMVVTPGIFVDRIVKRPPDFSPYE